MVSRAFSRRAVNGLYASTAERYIVASHVPTALVYVLPVAPLNVRYSVVYPEPSAFGTNSKVNVEESDPPDHVVQLVVGVLPQAPSVIGIGAQGMMTPAVPA